MNTNIFVPKKINVGFQNRKDTYSGKLAYVIYFDEKGKLRKETSWNSWRDEKIPNEIYDNEPTEGFVLNKKVGGVEECWGWDPRKTYTRVYDPRGFEFEITVPNLLWILENCNCIKGKGLEGEFVYGWDGKELLLVPVDSPDYQEIQDKNKIIHNNEFIKAKDLVLGTTYETLNGERYVYMGKYDVYTQLTNRYRYRDYWSREKEWEITLDETWMDDVVYGDSDRRYKNVNAGKQFWFIRLGDPNAEDWSWYKKDRVCHFKSVTRKFSMIVTSECEKYPEYYEMMEKDYEFSPIDYNRNKILPIPFVDFNRALTEHMSAGKTNCFYFYVIDGGRLVQRCIEYQYRQAKYCYRLGNTYNPKIVYVDINSIEDVYNQFKPMYGEQYLENGKLYTRRGYYGSEE